MIDEIQSLYVLNENLWMKFKTRKTHISKIFQNFQLLQKTLSEIHYIDSEKYHILYLYLSMIPNFIKIDNQTYFADIQIGMNKVLIRYTYNISSEWEDLQQACNRMVALLQAKWLIAKPEVKRSVMQNAIYWKWMEVVSDETGNHKDVIHALMKKNFLSKRKLVKIGWKRNYVNIEWSTKELSVKRFTKYLDDIYQFFLIRDLKLPTEDKLDMDSLINTYWNR